MRRIAAILFAGAAVAGCSDTTAPIVETQSRAPSYDFTNGPPAAGPFVYRTNSDDFFLFFSDDRSADLVAIMRVPDAPSDFDACGGSQPLDPASVQLVFHNSGAINLNLKGTDMHVWLYERHSFFAALNTIGLCGALNTQTPIGAGTANAVNHDNDAFFSGAHTDSFGFEANGIVTMFNTDSQYRFRDLYHGALAPDGTVLEFSSSITLTPLK